MKAERQYWKKKIQKNHTFFVISTAPTEPIQQTSGTYNQDQQSESAVKEALQNQFRVLLQNQQISQLQQQYQYQAEQSQRQTEQYQQQISVLRPFVQFAFAVLYASVSCSMQSEKSKTSLTVS